MWAELVMASMSKPLRGLQVKAIVKEVSTLGHGWKSGGFYVHVIMEKLAAFRNVCGCKRRATITSAYHKIYYHQNYIITNSENYGICIHFAPYEIETERAHF